MRYLEMTIRIDLQVPNRFSRIYPDGSGAYSQRLTIHATCPMDLKKFPLDNQMCPLLIGSYGYSAEDVVYQWMKKVFIELELSVEILLSAAKSFLTLLLFRHFPSFQPISFDDVSMSQFLFSRFEHGVHTNDTNRLTENGFRNDSLAYVFFFFERQTGFFILQVDWI